MNRAVIISILTLFQLLLVNCTRRPMDYDYTDKAEVTVILDWSLAEIDPNGATILFYPEKDGSVITKLAATDTVSLELEEGSYSILAFNETFNDFDNILFRGSDNINSLEAYVEAEGVKNNTDTVIYCNPDILAAATYNNFEVTADMIQRSRYLKKERTLTKISNSDLTIRLYPERIVHEVIVTAYIKGISNIASAGSYVSGFAGSVFVASGGYPNTGITQKVAFTEKVFLDKSSNLGYLRGTFYCFGPKGGFDTKLENYSLIFRSVLNNGQIYELNYSLDEKNIKFTNRKYNTDIECTVATPEDPIIIPDVGGNDGWHVTVGEWEDITVPIDF